MNLLFSRSSLSFPSYFHCLQTSVDTANNIAVAITDAGTNANPLVVIYQMREFNMIEIVIVQANDEPIPINYEKREYE